MSRLDFHRDDPFAGVDQDVDFVGVLRELEKALRFDSADVSGAIEDLDLLLRDFLAKITAAEADYLDAAAGGGADERLERVVYGRFLDKESRRKFFEDYKEIEALWEILSPAAELRPHIETFQRLAQLYAAVRNAYAERVGLQADLARKTLRLVQRNAAQSGLGRWTKSVTFDVRTLEALRGEPGADEAKVFNLARGLRQEIDGNPDAEAVLLPLQERAKRILEELEQRKMTGLEALDRLAALAAEKEAALKAMRDSGLSPRAFGVQWTLRDDAALANAGVAPEALAQEAEALLERFPNAAVNEDERRLLRAALYRPLLELEKDERPRIVETILAKLLGAGADADA